LLEFVFCEERNFFVKSFDTDFNLKLYSGQPVYDEENAVEVKFIKQPSLVEGFFLLAENASDYALASGDFNENDAYYKQTDEGFSRVYTLTQIKNNENIYYKEYADHVEENLQATKETFSAPV
jgi:hypothetical protein